MYQIGDWVQFRYDDVLLYGEIVPFVWQRDTDNSDCSYLVMLKGFVDPTWAEHDAIYYHGWSSRVGPEGARYLWIGHDTTSLAYYHNPTPPRPVSPVFYMVKEAT